jgi:hypothetical protein
MTKNLLLLAMLAAVAAFGHHGYAEYDRNAPVSLEGTVQQVMWGNPHVLITLQTESQGTYTVEWRAMLQLSRSGLNANPFKVGDRVIVTGCVNKNPERHILTLVREMSRPADGWNWKNPAYNSSK